MLAGKNALIFAATGGIGSEVARTFARDGAHVYISGRNAAALERLVGQIRQAGGLSAYGALFERLVAEGQLAV